MGTVAVSVILEPKSHINADNWVNTFCFVDVNTPPSSESLVDIGSALGQLYVGKTGTQVKAIHEYLGDQVDRSNFAHEFVFYDISNHLDGSPHGSPIHRQTFTLPPATATQALALPSELAIACTYAGDYDTAPEFGPNDPITGEPTRPRARRRGRFYFGPINNSVTAIDPVTGIAHVSSVARADLCVAMQRLVNDAKTSWHVWSRKNADTEVVTNGWVDNAFDIQRRRGERPTQKTLWTVNAAVVLPAPNEVLAADLVGQ